MEPHPHKGLSIRIKILLIVAASIVLLAVVIYTVSTQVLLKSYLTIEREGVVQNIQRANDAIQGFGDQQTGKILDWAQWDDIYYYAQDREANKAFEEETLVDVAAINLDVNIMMVVDAEGKLVHVSSVDPTIGEAVPGDALVSRLLSEKTVVTHPDIEHTAQGIIMMPDGPLFFSSRPLTTTEGLGPATGALIFARYLDEEKVQELGDITHLTLELFPYHASENPEDVTVAEEQLTIESPYVVAPISHDQVRGYTLLYNLHDEPVLTVRIETPREIYNQGQTTFTTFLIIAVGAILILGLGILILFDRVLLARFTLLSKEVGKIGEMQDFSMRVKEDVHDEIGALAGTFNHFLEKLALSQEAERKSKAEIVSLLRDIEAEKQLVEEKVVVRTKQLRDEKARLLASINSLSFGFIIADSTDQIAVSNPALTTTLALTKVPTSVRDLTSIFKNAPSSVDPLALARKATEQKAIVEERDVVYGNKKLRLLCAPIFAEEEGHTKAIGYVILIEQV